MLFYEFNVGEESYKLRLNTRNVVALEKMLGTNPLAIFGDGDTIPKVTDMVAILFTSLQAYNHGISLDDAYNIFDKWLEQGHSAIDFISVILEVYKVSGIVRETTTEKN